MTTHQSNTFEEGRRRSSCCKFCPQETTPFNPFEEDTGQETPPLNSVYIQDQQPFSLMYILNLFMAPDMKQYLQEMSPADDIYQLPVHLTKLILEARMSNDKEAYQRLEKVRDYVRGGLGSEDTAGMIEGVNQLIHDDDALANILN